MTGPSSPPVGSTPAPEPQDQLVEVDLLVDDVSIDGRCRVCRGGCMAAEFFTGLPLDGPDPSA